MMLGTLDITLLKVFAINSSLPIHQNLDLCHTWRGTHKKLQITTPSSWEFTMQFGIKKLSMKHYLTIQTLIFWYKILAWKIRIHQNQNE